MTGLVRKATLLGVLGLFIAASASAFVPEPTTSTAPSTIYVVGQNAALAPDVDGANGPPSPGVGTSNVITIKDFAGNPVSNIGLRIKFTCDINLCTQAASNPGSPYTDAHPGGWAQTVTCTPDASGRNVLNLTTDPGGQVQFVALGGSKTPGGNGDAPGGIIGVAGNPGTAATLITVDNFAGGTGTFKTTNAAVMNQNGATTGDDLSALDASLVLGAFLPPNAQLARCDLDGNGSVTALDASTNLNHFFRVGGAGNPPTCGGLAGYCTKTCTP